MDKIEKDFYEVGGTEEKFHKRYIEWFKKYSKCCGV